VDTMKAENRRAAVEPDRVSSNGKRFFSAAYKRSIVEKCLVAGASVSAVSLAHGFNANLVRKWIKQHTSGAGQHGGSTALVPVRVIASGTKPGKQPKRTVCARAPEVASGWIEIEVGAARLILRGKVDVLQLRVVLDALGIGR
jgi:transposase